MSWGEVWLRQGFFEEFFYHLRVGLAAGLFHDLAGEEREGVGFAGFIVVNGLGVSFKDLGDYLGNFFFHDVKFGFCLVNGFNNLLYR